MKGFVYTGRLNKESLLKLVSDFFAKEESFHIRQEIDIYEPKEGLPLDIARKGQVFSERGEVRWEEKNGKYFVVILSEHEVATIPVEIAPVNGSWTIEKKELYLTSPSAPHISPSFEKYPKQINDTVPRLLASFYYKDGIATFVSPRRFMT
jgi:hypothetical protein